MEKSESSKWRFFNQIKCESVFIFKSRFFLHLLIFFRVNLVQVQHFQNNGIFVHHWTVRDKWQPTTKLYWNWDWTEKWTEHSCKYSMAWTNWIAVNMTILLRFSICSSRLRNTKPFCMLIVTWTCRHAIYLCNPFN